MKEDLKKYVENQICPKRTQMVMHYEVILDDVTALSCVDTLNDWLMADRANGIRIETGNWGFPFLILEHDGKPLDRQLLLDAKEHFRKEG